MPSKSLSRRHFLKSSAALTGAAVAGAAVAQEEAPKFTLDQAGQDAVESMHGVDYTDTEWAQLLEGYDDVLTRIKTRRTDAPMDNRDEPALTFDPRLPGRTYPNPKTEIVVSQPPQAFPDKDEDIAFASLVQQAHWIRERQITSERLTEIYLTRIAKYAPKLENFITVTADLAREQAQAADKALRNNDYRGPLHGIPYALKDLADTAGIKTTWGAAPWKDRVPSEDATIVKKLRDYGAVLLGKTSLGALAYNDLWFGGFTRNPWAPEEGSSGSSAGSASATAAGLCSFSIGTETLGSIVSPSTRCGVTGLRPTFGRISRAGAMALCWSLDKFGPICRSVEDTAVVLRATVGYDAADPSSIDNGFAYTDAADEGVTIGFNPAWFEDATESDRMVLEMLRDMGYTMKEVTLPDLPLGGLLTTLEAEAAAAFEDMTLTDKDDLLAWQTNRAWPNTFRGARFLSAIELVQSDRLRRKLMEGMAAVYDEVDVIACPNFAAGMLIRTNFTGSPSLTLPVGFEERKLTPPTNQPGAEPGEKRRLPHTFTLWGNMLREDQILAIGNKLEAEIGFAKNRPADFS